MERNEPEGGFSGDDNQDQACWCESMGGVDGGPQDMTTRTDDGGRSHVVKIVMKDDAAKIRLHPDADRRRIMPTRVSTQRMAETGIPI